MSIARPSLGPWDDPLIVSIEQLAFGLRQGCRLVLRRDMAVPALRSSPCAEISEVHLVDLADSRKPGPCARSANLLPGKSLAKKKSSIERPAEWSGRRPRQAIALRCARPRKIAFHCRGRDCDLPALCARQIENQELEGSVDEDPAPPVLIGRPVWPVNSIVCWSVQAGRPSADETSNREAFAGGAIHPSRFMELQHEIAMPEWRLFIRRRDEL